MTPIKEFIRDYFGFHSRNIRGMWAILTDTGYYGYEHNYPEPLTYREHFVIHNSIVDWCNVNYPNDYALIGGKFFFTNKNIAILMKLSVL